MHRPGLRAARELHVVEPLADAGLGKREIRMLAATWSLPVARQAGDAVPGLTYRRGRTCSIGRLGLVERAEIAVRARLAEAGVQPRDLRVRLLGNGFAVELDRLAHAALETLPGLTAEVVTEMSGLGLTGAGR